MREDGSQAVVWQTAINPVVALELLATGVWSGSGRARAGGVRRRAVPRPADGLRLAVGDARGRVGLGGRARLGAGSPRLMLDFGRRRRPTFSMPLDGILERGDRPRPPSLAPICRGRTRLAPAATNRARSARRHFIGRGPSRSGRRSSPGPPRRGSTGGSQSAGASWKPANSKAGVTMQPISVHAPSGRAVCHAPAGTTACTASPPTTSPPSRWTVIASSPSAQTRSSSGPPARKPTPRRRRPDASATARRPPAGRRSRCRAGARRRARRTHVYGVPAALGLGTTC